MTLVVEASALVLAGVGPGGVAKDLRDRLVTEDCHAPHLIDAELGNVLRRQVHRAQLTASAADIVLRMAPRLVDYRYAHTGRLATAAWELRDNLSFYDALYVALASALRAPLVTLDRRLASGMELPCEVELIGPEG